MKTVYIKRTDLFKNIDMVLCNHVEKVDPDFVEDNIYIYYNACENCKGEDCEDCGGGGTFDTEPYQMFLLNLNQWDRENLTEWGVTLGYSDALDLDVLPIYDFGTSWDDFSYSKEVPDDYELGFNESWERQTVY